MLLEFFMLVPLSWLREIVDPRLPTDELSKLLSLSGLEVESVEAVGDWWDHTNLVAAKVLRVEAHPASETLFVVTLDAGGAQPEQVVTGAADIGVLKDRKPMPNVIVPFARAGAKLIDSKTKEQKTIESITLKGVPSGGALCSERELGLSDSHDGVLRLDESAKPGTSLEDMLADDVLEVAILPDTARCLAMTGVAREVASLVGSTLKLPQSPAFAKGTQTTSQFVDVSIEDASLGYRYIAVLIQDVTVGESPAWMRERLIKSGMKPINNVVDITNYVMLEWGQPSHAFDYDTLQARAGAKLPAIAVRRAVAGEKLVTLDGVDRPLEAGMLVIADAAGPVAVAGVMGGAATEIRPETKNVLLEVAAFDRVAIRRTAQKLKLSSEASYRFSRGIPQQMCEVAARRAAELLGDIAGGSVVGTPVDCYPTPETESVIYLTPGQVRRQLGIEVGIDEISSVLTRLDFAVEIGESDGWPWQSAGDGSFGLRVEPGEPMLRCVAPWYRLDARFPADLVEEIARLIGFGRLEPTLMSDQLPRTPRERTYDAEENLRDILIGCGLQETINYSLTTPAAHERLGMNGEKYVTLANPLNSDRRVMRRSMLVSALENIAYNARFTERLATFEIGRVYLPERGDGVRPLEERRVSIALAGARRRPSLHADPGGAEPFDFYDLKAMVETVLRKCGLLSSSIRLAPRVPDDTFSARAANVFVGEQYAGCFGELNPFAQSKLGVKLPAIYLAELMVAPLASVGWNSDLTITVNRFPSVIEDLAFIVDNHVLAQDVARSIRIAGGDSLAEVEMFDVFTGPPLQTGTRSLAYRVAYQGHDGPMTEATAKALRDRIVARVAADTKGVLRGG